MLARWVLLPFQQPGSGERGAGFLATACPPWEMEMGSDALYSDCVDSAMPRSSVLLPRDSSFSPSPCSAPHPALCCEGCAPPQITVQIDAGPFLL